MSEHFTSLLIFKGRLGYALSKTGFSLSGTNCMVTITRTFLLQALKLCFLLKCVSHLKTLLKAAMNVENLVMVWDLEVVYIFSMHTLVSLALQTRIWNSGLILSLWKANVLRKFINAYTYNILKFVKATKEVIVTE